MTLDETLTSALAGRKVLLLVDNAEHLLPELADAVRLSVARCRRRLSIVTSRERLQLEGERVYAVPSLAAAEGAELFLQRARGLGVELEATPAVAQLCARLDQRRWRSSSRRRERRSSALRSSSTDSTSGSTSLQGGGTPILGNRRFARRSPGRTIFSTHRSNSCSVVSPSSTAGAPTRQQSTSSRHPRTPSNRCSTRAWCDERRGDVPRGTGCSRRSGSTRARSSPTRMRTSLLQQRHSAFFAELVDEAHAAVLGPEQPAWLAVLDAEAANWSAALRRLLAQSQVDRAARMAGNLTFYWWFRGRADEGLPFLTASLEGGSRIPPPERGHSQVSESLPPTSTIASSSGKASSRRARSSLSWAMPGRSHGWMRASPSAPRCRGTPPRRRTTRPRRLQRPTVSSTRG